VWWGIVTGNIIGGASAFLWASMYIRGLVEREPVLEPL